MSLADQIEEVGHGVLAANDGVSWYVPYFPLFPAGSPAVIVAPAGRVDER